jgi:hypothetical protein
MNKTETPEERKQRLLSNLARGRATAKARKEQEREAGIDVPVIRNPKRPKNLDKIVRSILDDETLVDKVIANQPEYWSKLPAKNGGYIIATVMMVKAMGGDIKAAEWIRKTGFGDKVLLETDNGFFSKSEFTIQVIPSDKLDDGISLQEVTDAEIKQIEE